MKDDEKRFDLEAVVWDEDPGRVRLAGDVFEALAREVELTADMDVMDFGCGTGLVTLLLAPRVRSVTAVDSSRGMLDVLRSKIEKLGIANVTPMFLNLEKGDTLSGTYDLVVSTMTLHHVQDIESLFEQFSQVTSASGLLCVADLDLYEGRFHESSEGVFHHGFDRQELKKVFTGAGFGSVRDRTAADVMKRISSDGMLLFSVFLMTGRNESAGRVPAGKKRPLMPSERHAWLREFPGAVTVCDAEGVIIEMNRRSEKMFEEQGGASLIGSNLLDCHPGPARKKIEEIMEKQVPNAYTIEKKGVWKMIYQSPWYEDGRYAGFVEIVFEIPAEMPHFVRKG